MDLDPTPPLRPLRVKDIVLAAAEHFDISLRLIFGPFRWGNVARARHMAMYLAYEHVGNISMLKLARIFNRDHTTVLHGIVKMRADATIAEDAAKIMGRAEEMTRWTDLELRKALEMRGENTPIKEIACMLARTEESVKSKFHHASGKKQLRKERSNARKETPLKPLKLPADFAPSIVEVRQDGTRMVEMAPGHITAEHNLKYFGVSL